MLKRLTPPSPHDPEHVKARYWREVNGWTREQLAKMTGFAPGSIAQFEKGVQGSSGRPISDEMWQRYRQTCAAAALGVQFDWISCTLHLQHGAKVTLSTEDLIAVASPQPKKPDPADSI